ANNPLPELMPHIDVHPFQIFPEGWEVRESSSRTSETTDSVLEMAIYHKDSESIVCSSLFGTTAIPFELSDKQGSAFWSMKKFPAETSAVWMHSRVADRVKWNADLIFLAEASAAKIRQWSAKQLLGAHFEDGRVRGESVVRLVNESLTFV